ncbi:hypothetical protein [Flavobacterium reichenbachii]|uniref:DUF4783 domain-containing protein n=1 Tax=Flavobacterium reichenbachii TaxID=362418 RepID=A0A085ZQ95_9FLAO|nr:hypothetical protein [Flavobacterium reichenbachii]KFF06609.1 hypothetical protein IW19_14320 [Flavobacterium reichenbachii]OXB18788.1 hypothetical protein B0A68_01875 [Flavobacterium reichenbachii]
MKKIFLSLVFLYSISGFTQEKLSLSAEQKTNISKIAKTWVEELAKAENLDKITEISDVPFALDRKKVLTKTADLKAFYSSVFKNKGKRNFPKLRIQILDYKAEILEQYIPISVAKVAVYIGEDEHSDAVVLCILIKNDTYKVIGFSD